MRKPAEQRGFAVQPRRWVVERTLAWLTTHRRLAVTTNATSRPPKPSSAGPPSTACYAGSPADNPPDANCAAPSPGPDQHLKHSLSDREREVLLLLAQGLSNTDISAQLFITESTVKSHLSSILVNLECQNRVQAAHLVYRAGLLR